MKYVSAFGRKLEHLCRVYFPLELVHTIFHSLEASMVSSFHYVISHAQAFWLQLCYFIFFSFAGFLALKVSKPRTDDNPHALDLFFTSVSATTVSSMSTVEMEVFSNDQLIVMTILMFLGGEVFTSMLCLHLQRFKSSWSQKNKTRDISSSKVDSVLSNDDQSSPPVVLEQVIELGVIAYPPSLDHSRDKPFNGGGDEEDLKYKSIKSLGYVVLGYLLVVHVVGSCLISVYISLSPSANNVLKGKGLVLQTFSIFTTVSTFTNCGFVPTNENMMVFRKNSGLLFILIPQILLGNILFPPCLRLVIHVLDKFTNRIEYKYILTNYQELSFGHLKSSKESCFLVGTVLVFSVVQFVSLTALEWSSGALEGMSSFEKVVGSLFQAMNSRHSGESIVDFSTVSSAILVLFVLMMYLPPYASFLPIGDQRQEALCENNKSSKKNVTENMLLSPLSYLAIFVIVICITERQSLKDDPLNFNVINIVFEVISAYGNVGYSTGYSCKRRLKFDKICEDKWYGFAGRWSKGGKITLILVMFFGRLKKFNLHGGKAWKLS